MRAARIRARSRRASNRQVSENAAAGIPGHLLSDSIRDAERRARGPLTAEKFMAALREPEPIDPAHQKLMKREDWKPATPTRVSRGTLTGEPFLSELHRAE